MLCGNIDLPQLNSIELGSGAFNGDSRPNRKSIDTTPYNYKNTLIMRSEIAKKGEWIDLPSLTLIKGILLHFYAIGSVILESTSR